MAIIRVNYPAVILRLQSILDIVYYLLQNSGTLISGNIVGAITCTSPYRAHGRHKLTRINTFNRIIGFYLNPSFIASVHSNELSYTVT